MALAMRLARGGRKKRPFYRIVVADKRMPRDGRYIEKLGTYNPLLANDDDKRVVLNEDRIKHWLGEGAKPSERVEKILAKAGIVPVPEQPNRPQKSAPSEKTLMKRKDKEEKLAAAEEAAKEAEEAAKAEAETPAEDAPAEEKTEEAAAEAEAPAEEEKAEEKAEEAPAEEDKKEDS